MKPHRLTIASGSAQSFSGRHDVLPDINNRWHYHDELELIYIKKGKGTQFIGDSISNFADGNVVLIGSNLPHLWQFDTEYFKEGLTEAVDVYVVHFARDFWGRDFLNLPENQELNKVIEHSKQGIQITGPERKVIAELIEEIVETSGSRKIINLMEALLEIGRCKEVNYLVSFGFQYDFQQTERDRIQSIYNYTILNYKKKIELQEIAQVAKISRNSFCKFFKSRTGKTYSLFTNEIRIGHACRLLIENKMSVKEICFECGFYNFASFHKCFKDITGMTPLKYQKSYN
ncbi:AraC family transcriptional regulator [Flavobacterium subsaxonicum]|uniref:Transcriptional regulator n=1 Tax=Flavobacterium subsaxonicum WB 4.1-42 = DSM 21790 TaxID=1121898 RepID=A0A0A2MHF9_9FLAO|nr:AraC family transcriptional regulator [Flavobacterium subsaxonicum]KGO91699.1 transcriptional regulator [Flavobacterium subsaxonicum WB 4.1-42 = DSM 21790]